MPEEVQDHIHRIYKHRRLLIADDDPSLRSILTMEFKELGFTVTGVASCEEFTALRRFDFDYAIVDLKLGLGNGLTIVQSLCHRTPKCRTVILTGYGSIATAVKATKLGAANYLMKPASVTDLLTALQGDSNASEFPEVEAKPLTLARAEREYIESIMLKCNGNISKAALQLGMHRQSLQRKLRKYTPHK